MNTRKMAAKNTRRTASKNTRKTAAKNIKRTAEHRPRYVSEPEWRGIVRIGKTKSYELIRDGRVRSFKLDGKRLIDLDASIAMLKRLERKSRA